jgi:hypothetical protein
MDANRDQENNGPLRPQGIDPQNVTDGGRPEMAEAVSEPGSVDMNRPIGFGEPGHGAAPGGEPVAPPGEEGGGQPVAPPGTADGGNPGGPPAFHEQPPK